MSSAATHFDSASRGIYRARAIACTENIKKVSLRLMDTLGFSIYAGIDDANISRSLCIGMLHVRKNFTLVLLSPEDIF